jgi:phosphoesterase RecJ-like protein
MELTPKQQTVELIRAAERILIVTHTGLDGDAIGSTVALRLALAKLGKDVSAAAPEAVPPVFGFLAGSEQISGELGGTKDFVISLDTSRVAVEKLGYKNVADEKKLNIIITPQQGSFRPEDVSFGAGSLKYDLVIVLDSPEIERLGRFFDGQAQFFYETPLINIDHHAGNDFFGKVNWVDLTATSTAEILVALLESLGREKSLLDANIATALLTGITTDTESFQNATTTPKSLTVAAQLVAAGGRQQEIVQHIYRTKTLSTLRLWGKALTKLQEEKTHRFLWSKISVDDLKSSQADESELSGVADELLRSAPNIDFVLLLSERKGGFVHASLRSVGRGVDVSEIAKLFNGGGQPAAAAFRLPNANLDEAEREILDALRTYQKNRLALASNQAGTASVPSPTRPPAGPPAPVTSGRPSATS